MDDISIHAPLAGCDEPAESQPVQVEDISIHAPLAGCDRDFCRPAFAAPISIHAPLAGCDVTLS